MFHLYIIVLPYQVLYLLQLQTHIVKISKSFISSSVEETYILQDGVMKVKTPTGEFMVLRSSDSVHEQFSESVSPVGTAQS